MSSPEQGPDMGKCRPGASRKVPPPKNHRLKQSQAFQDGVNFENFTEVKFRDILLAGTRHRDRRLNRDVW